jgi:hypothetical protein
VTFGWDHVGAEFTCAPTAGGTPATHKFPRGTNGSFVCNSKTYQLTWTANAASVPGYNADGSTWTGVYRYRYRGLMTAAMPAGAIQVNATGPGDFSFSVPAAGAYWAWGSVGLSADSSSNSFLVSMDGVQAQVWDTPIVGSGQTAGAKVWARVSMRPESQSGEGGTPAVYNLSAGQHVFSLMAREAGTTISGLVFAPADSPAPGGASQLFAGEVVPNQAPITLNYQDGELELEVQTIRSVGAQEETSAWAKSTDPAFAVVDGAARGWVVKIKSPETPPPTPDPPGAIKGMRLIQ